jgi:hypothetical protein
MIIFRHQRMARCETAATMQYLQPKPRSLISVTMPRCLPLTPLLNCVSNRSLVVETVMPEDGPSITEEGFSPGFVYNIGVDPRKQLMISPLSITLPSYNYHHQTQYATYSFARRGSMASGHGDEQENAQTRRTSSERSYLQIKTPEHQIASPDIQRTRTVGKCYSRQWSRICLPKNW